MLDAFNQPDSEEEEQESEDQAAVDLVDVDAACLCRTHWEFGARAWRCLGNGCPFENAKSFLTKRGPEGKTLVAIPPTYPRLDPDQKSRGYLS